MKEKCINCFYWRDTWQSNIENNLTGFCYRYPPLLDPVYVGNMPEDFCAATENACSFVRPITTDGDFCGEFKPKKGVRR